MSKNRIVYTDALKILACIGVILIHVAAQNFYKVPVTSNAWNAFNLYDSIARWSVPIFVMVTGVFIFDSKANPFKKYMPWLLKLIFLWGIIYCFSDVLLKGNPITLTTLSESIKRTLLNKSSAHLWYLYTLLGLYLVAPILKIFIKNASKKDILYFIILSLIFTVVVPTLANIKSLAILSQISKTLNVNVVLGYPLYLACGYYLHNFTISKICTWIIYILGIVSLIFTYVITGICSVNNGSPFLGYYANFSLNVFFTSIALFLFVKNCKLFNKENIIITKIVHFLVKHTFGIYLTHQLIINILRHLNLDTLKFNAFISVPTISLIVLCLSFVFSYILNTAKPLKKIFF